MENNLAGLGTVFGAAALGGGPMIMTKYPLIGNVALFAGVFEVSFGVAAYDTQVRNLRRKLEHQSSQ